MQVRKGREENSSGFPLISPSRQHSVSALTCSGPLFHHYLPLFTLVSVPATSDYAYPSRLALDLCHSICGGPHNQMSLSAFQLQIFIEKPHWPTSPKHFDPGHLSLGSHKSPLCFGLPLGEMLTPGTSLRWYRAWLGPQTKSVGLGRLPEKGIGWHGHFK